MPFTIAFDYRFDTRDFFTEEVRAELEAAADAWESVIQDEFADVPAGVTFSLESPSEAPTSRTVRLAEPIDDLRIFVGAQDPPFGRQAGDALAKGGVRGFNAAGDVLQRRISDDFRGQGPTSDFEPFVGAISVDPDTAWSFDPNGPGPDEQDFRTVAMHEIGHVLGFGQAGIFRQLGENESFDGPNARSINDGEPIPLAADLAHTAPTFRDGTPLMSPTVGVGTRRSINDVEKALLADIGYEFEGFESQGELPSVTTEGPDSPVFGTVVADTIDGRGGDDQLQGDAGDDTLLGGDGDDLLLGQAGDDSLAGGAGDDQLQGGGGADLLRVGSGADVLFGEGNPNAPDESDTFYIPADGGSATIQDFNFDTESVLIDPALGFSSGEEVRNTAAFGLTNAIRLELGSGGSSPRVDLVHESTTAPSLSADNIAIGTPATMAGGGSGSGDDPVAPDGPPADVVANAFLRGGAELTVADPIKVFGRADGREVVVLDTAANGVRADANIERFTFADPLDSMFFNVTARGLEISAGGDRLVTIPSLNQTTELRFSDGRADLRQTGADSYELRGANGDTEVLDASGGPASVSLAETADGSDDGDNATPAADLFLAADARVTVQDSVAAFGRSGGNEGIALTDAASEVRLDANVERLDLPRPLAELRFGVGDAGLEIAGEDGTTFIEAGSLNQPMAVRFADGNATLEQMTATSFELIGASGGRAPISGESEQVSVDLGGDTAAAMLGAAGSASDDPMDLTSQ